MQGQAHRPDLDASHTPPRRSDSLTLHLTDVRVTLPAETVGALAAVLARRLPAPAPPDPSPYLTVAEAAAYLRASRQRVYDLLSSRRLSRRKDGARVLISRAELDAYLGQP
jgi:excisionase family DNA binding protein